MALRPNDVFSFRNTVLCIPSWKRKPSRAFFSVGLSEEVGEAHKLDLNKRTETERGRWQKEGGRRGEKVRVILTKHGLCPSICLLEQLSVLRLESNWKEMCSLKS